LRKSFFEIFRSPKYCGLVNDKEAIAPLLGPRQALGCNDYVDNVRTGAHGFRKEDVRTGAHGFRKDDVRTGAQQEHMASERTMIGQELMAPEKMISRKPLIAPKKRKLLVLISIKKLLPSERMKLKL